jgi:4-hydroxybenzoate polyprenyltransferase
MVHLLRLARPINLFIIAATMVTMRYGVLQTLLAAGGRELQMPVLDFWLLLFSTLLIAAGGNIINDYFDTRIDRINKPDQVIVGRQVGHRMAMAAHALTSVLGLCLGGLVAWRSNMLWLGVVPAFAVGALWSYSTTFKRRVLIGNGLVAVLTALVPLLVGVYEIEMDRRTYTPELLGLFHDPEMVDGYFAEIWTWIWGYAAFAFVSSLLRELQKDMADVEGDAAMGCRTVPIAWGMPMAKALALVWVAVLVLALLLLRMRYLNGVVSFWYIGLGVQLPLMVAGFLSYTAQERRTHLRAGMVLKVAMVAAVGYAFVLRYSVL